MIDELLVRNLGVIESARLEPGPALTVITGETGTGKTLLLGALRLLLGGDARSDLVGPFGDEAVAEGRFVDSDGTEIGAARRLARHGRSRAYLDASIASAAALEERVAGMVELIGQHDHLTLTRAAEVRRLVDSALDDEGRAALASYQEAWRVLVEYRAARDGIGGDLPSLARELDLVKFQADEIASAGFEPGDDDRLSRLAGRLRNADEISGQLSEALESLDGGRDRVGDAVAAIRKAARMDPDLEGLAAEMSVAAETLTVHAADIRSAADGIELDPDQQAEVEARLTALGELRRKYGRTLTEILEFGVRARERRSELEQLLERSAVIDDEVSAAEQAVASSAEALTAARRKSGQVLSQAAIDHLRDLGFSDPHIDVQMDQVEPSSTGADSVSLVFASDSRLAPGPVAQVASGGELSRLVLALRLAGDGGTADTLVFDEVDAGIGGTTALALARKLAHLAEDHQVLCVTHLPQLAAFADRHYVVTREGTTAAVGPVEGDDRVAELSRMLAGLPESDRGREAAEELLELAGAG